MSVPTIKLSPDLQMKFDKWLDQSPIIDDLHRRGKLVASSYIDWVANKCFEELKIVNKEDRLKINELLHIYFSKQNTIGEHKMNLSNVYKRLIEEESKEGKYEKPKKKTGIAFFDLGRGDTVKYKSKEVPVTRGGQDHCYVLVDGEEVEVTNISDLSPVDVTYISEGLLKENKILDLTRQNVEKIVNFLNIAYRQATFPKDPSTSNINKAVVQSELKRYKQILAMLDESELDMVF